MSAAAPPRNPRFWQTSLVARLVLYFLLWSLLSVLILGLVGYSQAKKALERSVLARLEVSSTLKADALGKWAEDQRREFLLFANLQPVRSAAEELLRHDEKEPGFRKAEAELRTLFGAIADSKREWQEVLVLSPKGKVLVSTTESHEGDYRLFDSFFLGGREGTHVEKVYPSPFTYRPTMSFSKPIGESRGVLAVHLDLSSLDRIVRESTGLGEGSESYLVDNVNVLLSGERFGSQEYRRGVRSHGIDAALDGESGSGLYRNYRGTSVLGVYRPVSDLDVALLVEIPQQQAFAPAGHLLATIVLVGAVGALILAAGTYLLARQIARPVLAVRDAAVLVSQGDLEVRAPVVTQDEVGVLAEAFNQMTRQVKERTDELTRFTYTVSHDLKSPLVTIHGFLGLLEKDLKAGDAEQVTADLDHIRGAAKTMQELLQELLELSRIGRIMNPPEAVPLADLLPEVLAAVEGRLKERGVEVEVAEGLGVVYGDRVRILEVFQNLIDNASRFMGDQPSPRVEIGSRPQGDVVLCYVRDNGIGIDPQYHEKVFGLFERLDPDTEGTGIGLALVQRIVEHYGGRIWIDSAGEGHGSTFTFTLPGPPEPSSEPQEEE